jgi:hypothetical protein
LAALTLAEWLALAAALWAVLQLAAASWRDLGPLTIGLLGASVMTAEQEAIRGDAPSKLLLALLVAGGLLAAVAWARGARHNVGRLALNGLSLLAAIAACTLPWLLPSMWLGRPVPLVGVAAIPCGLVALIATAAALERPGNRYVRPRWYRRIRVEA